MTMRPVLIIAFLFLAGLPGLASASSSMVRFGSKVIVPNDTVSRLLDVAGEPITRTPILNEYGVKIGEYWTYRPARTTYTMLISGGRIADIEESSD